MNTASARSTALRAGLGFAAVVGVLQLVPHEPLAELPKIALVEYPLEATEGLSESPRPPEAIRVFVVGSSVEMGYPYRPDNVAAYATQLEVGLRACFPDREVVCRAAAQPAVASPAMVGIVDEVLRFDPSLVFVCMGGNEFMDRVFYGEELVPDGVFASVRDRCTRSRLLFQQIVRALEDTPERADIEVQQEILERGTRSRPGDSALGALPLSRSDRALILERTGASMQAMARACEAAGVPLAFGLTGTQLRRAWTVLRWPGRGPTAARSECVASRGTRPLAARATRDGMRGPSRHLVRTRSRPAPRGRLGRRAGRVRRGGRP